MQTENMWHTTDTLDEHAKGKDVLQTFLGAKWRWATVDHQGRIIDRGPVETTEELAIASWECWLGLV